jgi:hypothetical protein
MDITQIEKKKLFIEKIFTQSPPDTTYQNIEDLVNTYNYDSVKILSELWNINSNITSNVCYTEEEKKNMENKIKWDTIRDICDSHDLEMKKVMKHI